MGRASPVGTLGSIIIGTFVGAWLISFLVYRAKGYDTLEVAAPGAWNSRDRG